MNTKKAQNTKQSSPHGQPKAYYLLIDINISASPFIALLRSTMFPHLNIVTVHSFNENKLPENNKNVEGKKTHTIMARSSTVVGHVGYH